MRYFLILIAAVLMTSAVAVNAQVSISVSFNVDRQPIWGPTGYDHVDYYYLPDIDVYYNVQQSKYYYSDARGRWISGSSLPRRYRGFDLYHSYKVVVNEREPYRNNAKYRDQYASFKGHHDQETIRDSRDSKYFVNPRHPEHKAWVKQNKANKGNGKQNNHGNNQGQQPANDNGNGKEKDRGNDPGRK